MTKTLALLLTLCGLVGTEARAQTAGAASAKSLLKLSFNGTEYLHRWSKDGQSEFTPAGDENLETWKDMVTINVHEPVRTGDDLASLANQVLGRYQTTGRVLRTDSKPKTKDHEADFAAVIFANPTAIEAAFAHFLLFEKRGVVVVCSKRIYGAKVDDPMSAWLDKNGPAIEKSLMAWDRIPLLVALQALPQATGK